MYSFLVSVYEIERGIVRAVLTKGIDRMTLRELIDKATFIGRQLSSAEIPVVYNGVSDNLTTLELSIDNHGNYYVNIR